ncbi:MAG: threonine ammonia-lyase [Aeromicrobium erythreum]
MTVHLPDVERARTLLAPVVEVTPMAHSRWLSTRAGTPVHLKCENLQRTGSFKIRGAYTRIAGLSDAERERGVVAASAGNHAQGVALAASLLGTRATIFMPEGAALPKVAATRGYGAEIRFAGTGVTEALVHALAFAEETGAVLIHPFDHEDILAGQGTVGLEIVEQLPEVATIVVPLGGGGLAAGIALVRERRPDVRVVGVQAADAAAYPGSLAAGSPVAGVMGPTMADGIAVAEPGVVPFEVIKEQLDAVVTVSEESMSTALIGLLERAKMLVEPSGAAGVAALLDDPTAFEGPVVTVLSGGNVDPLVLSEVIRHGLSAAGRFTRLRVRFSDRPGELTRLLTDLAQLRVNVIDVTHDRSAEGLGVREVEVAVEFATNSQEHGDEVRERLAGLGHTLL